MLKIRHGNGVQFLSCTLQGEPQTHITILKLHFNKMYTHLTDSVISCKLLVHTAFLQIWWYHDTWFYDVIN